MRKILFIECCGDDGIYFDVVYKGAGYCRHSEGDPVEQINGHEIPLWCPLQDADKDVDGKDG